MTNNNKRERTWWLHLNKDIWFLLSIRVCRLGSLGRRRSFPSRLLSTTSSSSSVNILRPVSDLQQQGNRGEKKSVTTSKIQPCAAKKKAKSTASVFHVCGECGPGRACQGSEWQELVVLSSPGMVRHPSAAGRMRDGGHLWVARIQNKRLQKCGGQDEFVNVLCLEAPGFAWP